MPTPSLRRFLLDTNVLQQLQQAVGIVLPCIVLGELYYGARNSGRVAANVQRVDGLGSQKHILNCDVETAQQCGLIRESLRAKGKPLPENDVWMAAPALQHNLVLVSRDAHFNETEGLSVVAW